MDLEISMIPSLRINLCYMHLVFFRYIYIYIKLVCFFIIVHLQCSFQCTKKFIHVCVCVCVVLLLSRIQLLATPWTTQPTSLLCPRNSLDKHTGVGSHSLFQGIFLTQGSNPSLLHYRQILYHLSHQGSLDYLITHVTLFQVHFYYSLL